jgi:dipeptidase D
VTYINELVGTGLYAEKFGDIAYTDAFMGDMTLAPTTVTPGEQGTNIFINLRRPIGKTADVLTRQTQAALAKWQKKHAVELANVRLYFGEPLVVKDAPHVDTLLGIFSHYTGIKNPKPISVGGSTNAKLLPSAVSFGPSMPGTEYTGHSEHEFISLKQLKLNLAMYTAMMIELGNM